MWTWTCDAAAAAASERGKKEFGKVNLRPRPSVLSRGRNTWCFIWLQMCISMVRGCRATTSPCLRAWRVVQGEEIVGCFVLLGVFFVVFFFSWFRSVKMIGVAFGRRATPGVLSWGGTRVFFFASEVLEWSVWVVGAVPRHGTAARVPSNAPCLLAWRVVQGREEYAYYILLGIFVSFFVAAHIGFGLEPIRSPPPWGGYTLFRLNPLSRLYPLTPVLRISGERSKNCRQREANYKGNIHWQKWQAWGTCPGM